MAERVAIVTGAASGIGRAMAGGLLAAGYRVAAVDRDEEGLAALAPSLAVPADLAKQGACERAVEAVLARFGHIDILVNNAGIGQPSLRPEQRSDPIRFWQITQAQWQNFLAVNATAPLMMARAVAPRMMAAGKGRIVTVTTSLGTMMREGYMLYGASKAAAEAGAAVMAADLRGTGVTCNVLVPGGVTDTALVADYTAEERARMLRPEIMVTPLLWLVSDAAAAVTGRRFVAARWDSSLPAEEAAKAAGAPIAWTSLGTMPIEPTS
ncbi:MAG: SDR family oxidoreductase [Rhodospirillales bacterium]|nr:SDR family oxidoreductase [Rhodospirillales bacterium]